MKEELGRRAFKQLYPEVYSDITSRMDHLKEEREQYIEGVTGQLDKALEVVKNVSDKIGARECVADSALGKVSIICTGMQNAPGYASRMFRTLSDNGINIQLIATSEIRITCIIDETRVKDAVLALHRAFELEKED